MLIWIDKKESFIENQVICEKADIVPTESDSTHTHYLNMYLLSHIFKGVCLCVELPVCNSNELLMPSVNVHTNFNPPFHFICICIVLFKFLLHLYKDPLW